MQAALLTDGYKTFHGSAMHDDIARMYGNFTNRSGRLSNLPEDKLGGVVHVGLQHFCIDTLMEGWKRTFFRLNKDVAVGRIKRILDAYLGIDYDVSHYEKLHDLGHLPLLIKAVPEGTIVPYGVAPFTIQTTKDGFEWLALYIETVMSTEIWPMATSATTAAHYMLQTKQALKKAGMTEDMAPFMCHDFSMRGMFGKQAGAMSGFSHLTAGHAGTDTLPALMFAEQYYGADVEKELVGCSVKATEHSITTSFIATYAEQNKVSYFDAEVAYARKLLKDNPTGILSYVADSFDFWKFVTEGLPLLKDDIMARDGTFVIRPDSGDPVDMLCGCGGYKLNNGLYRIPNPKNSKQDIEITEAESKGLVQCLADIFGTTDNGSVRLLDSHIGAIYGDSITVERQQTIYTRLIEQGLAPTVVLGVGSYSYQYVTRDTHGSAIKCTAAFLKDGSVVDVCKDPKTDSNKKSAKGLLHLTDGTGKIEQRDQQSISMEARGLLQPIFKNGELVKRTTLEEIRAVVKEQLDALVK